MSTAPDKAEEEANGVVYFPLAPSAVYRGTTVRSSMVPPVVSTHALSFIVSLMFADYGHLLSLCPLISLYI